MLDLAAAQADVFEPVIIHRRKLPHVAAGAQLIGDCGDEPSSEIEEGNPRPVSNPSLEEGVSQGSFHDILQATGACRLSMI
jgi:hypothetical protein